MQLRKKPEFPLESLTNHSNSQPDFPVLNSPSAQEDSKNWEVVQLIPEKVPDVCKQKRRGNSMIELPTASLMLGVLGILGAIALPSFLNSAAGCGDTAKQVEAKNNIDALNRAQQAYHLDYKNFTTSLTDLGVGIKTESEHYNHLVRTTHQAAFNYAISRKGSIRSYVGAVFTVPATNLDAKADKAEMITVAIACEALHPGTTQPAAPTLQKGIPACSEGTRSLSR